MGSTWTPTDRQERSAMGAHGLEQTDQEEVCEGKHKDSKYRQNSYMTDGGLSKTCKMDADCTKTNSATVRNT
jgi:hypothetical protein